MVDSRRTELHIGDRNYRTLVPDLAGWRRERLPQFPARWSDLKVMPDWVCEILSPSIRSIDLIRKRPIYGEAGVRHLWLIDPLAGTLEVFVNSNGVWQVLGAFAGSDEASVPPFEAVPLELGLLWDVTAEPE